MTRIELSLKLLRANFRRYRLYFLCNGLSVALFYCFAALLTNRKFMDLTRSVSMISSNVIAPSVLVAIFMALFVPASFGAFLRERKREYGVLVSLGLSEGEMLASLAVESLAVGAAALFGGLAAGTALSCSFYLVIHDVIGVADLQWTWNAEAYLVTAALYGGILLVAVAAGLLGVRRSRVIDLLKEKFRPERSRKPGLAWFVAGALLTLGSAPVVEAGQWTGSGVPALVGLCMLVVGVFLMMLRLPEAAVLLAGSRSAFSGRHMLELSFLRRNGRSLGRLGIGVCGLIAVAVFFLGLSVTIIPGLSRNAMVYAPYDMVFCQIFGKNAVNTGDVERLLNENGVEVRSLTKVGYLRNHAFNFLSASETKRAFGYDVEIPKGQYRAVLQYYPRDGYQHDQTVPSAVHLDVAGGSAAFALAGKDVRILFNRNPALADWTLVLNDEDYARLSADARDYWKGSMLLYTFGDWRNSQRAVDAVQRLLWKANGVDAQEQERYYRATSRVADAALAMQSASFLLFVMGFVAALFCGAAAATVRFRVMAEAEDARRMVTGLYRIGVTRDEMLRMIRNKNYYYYLSPAAAGVLIAVVYDFCLNVSSGYGWVAAGFALLAGAALFGILSLGVIWGSRQELHGYGF